MEEEDKSVKETEESVGSVTVLVEEEASAKVTDDVDASVRKETRFPVSSVICGLVGFSREEGKGRFD